MQREEEAITGSRYCNHFRISQPFLSLSLSPPSSVSNSSCLSPLIVQAPTWTRGLRCFQIPGTTLQSCILKAVYGPPPHSALYTPREKVYLDLTRYPWLEKDTPLPPCADGTWYPGRTRELGLRRSFAGLLPQISEHIHPETRASKVSCILPCRSSEGWANLLATIQCTAVQMELDLPGSS